MLVVDPMKRMTIPEIRQHVWFQAHLPRYLAVPPPDTMQQAKKVWENLESLCQPELHYMCCFLFSCVVFRISWSDIL